MHTHKKKLCKNEDKIRAFSDEQTEFIASSNSLKELLKEVLLSEK